MAGADLCVVPLTLKSANDLVTALHRHHRKVQGHRFSIGARNSDGVMVGAAIVGRPVCRHFDPTEVAEVTRLVTDGTRNACSLLYGAAARAAKAMGFQRIQTYTLEEESGASLRASGWCDEGVNSGPGGWDRVGRSRPDDQPLTAKRRWARSLK